MAPLQLAKQRERFVTLNRLRFSRRGFTLIELLVVIAIIAVLAGLLLSGPTNAKASAYSVVCRNNLRQLGVAMRMYVDDFRAYPSGISDAAGGVPIPWVDLGSETWPWSRELFPYLRESRKLKDMMMTLPKARRYRGVFRCPADAVNLGALSTTSLESAPFWFSSYGYNAGGSAGTLIPPEPPGKSYGLGRGIWGPGGANAFKTNYVTLPVAESDVKAPDDMIALADNGNIFAQGGLWRTVVEGGSPLRDSVLKTATYGRHRGRLNVAYCDAHVENMKVRQLLLDPATELRRKWNNDHLAH